MKKQIEQATAPDAAAKYRELIAGRAPEIITVSVPSGFPFKFKKPNAFALIFDERAGLPQSAATIASEKWAAQGVSHPVPADDAQSRANEINAERKVFDTVDRVCELSHEPKIVLGVPKNPGEISYSEIDSADLEYLYKFTAAGGNVSAMLTMFPGGQ